LVLCHNQLGDDCRTCYVPTTGRYVGTADMEDDGEMFEKKTLNKLINANLAKIEIPRGNG
jgi:hypothetical protein